VTPRSTSAVPVDDVAGIVTRAVAAVIDLLVVMAMLGGLLLVVAGLRFAWSPVSFHWPAPSWAQSLAIGALFAAAYLTVAWSTSGRTVGAGILGLRVLSARGTRLGWSRATVRAVFCVVFPIGLLWAAPSRHRRSVQDAVLRTVVVYDWSDDAGMHRPTSPGYGTPGRA
jgi:uncharacterized RDD family membrane protein YckC